MDRQPPPDARTFETAGAFLAIGGLVALFVGFAMEFEWVSLALKIGGGIGVVVGASLVVVGNIIRDWD
jgi:hypothetical protein